MPPSFVIGREEFEPGYVRLHRSGELRRRADMAVEKLRDCTLCPRSCHVNRSQDDTSVCKTGRYAVVSSHFAHLGEEDCLRGTRGSGTIFFSWCSLRCVFCQNDDLSWHGEGYITQPAQLAEMMLELQAQGCHNINFVSPTHVVPQILEALPLAVDRGLRLPLVYNSGGYDALPALALLDGVIDIYMPDFKFWDADAARRYGKAPEYPEAARQAIREMHRQVGPLVFDQYGIARRGLLLRHLVMPANLAGTAEIMHWVARELSPQTYVNIMAQYRPAAQVYDSQYPEINRCITADEFRDALDAARAAGLSRLDERSAMRASLG